MSERRSSVVTVGRVLQRGAAIVAPAPSEHDERLVQGLGEFADDVRRDDLAHVHLVRSPHPHARITGIDVSAAEKLDGVYGTLTGEEVATLTDPFGERFAAGSGGVLDYCLAVGRARFAGEPVAAVAARTPELARDAAALVEVAYEPLDAVRDGETALAPDAPVLHEPAGSNLVWQDRFDWGDVDGALAAADHVVRIERLRFERAAGSEVDRSAALVEHDPETQRFHVHCNHQLPAVAAIWMATALRIPLEKLRLVMHDAGGGSALAPHAYLTVCCLLARKVARPVRWTARGGGPPAAVAHGGERVFHDVEVAVQSDGTVLGFKAAAIDDCGAYPRGEPLGCVLWAQVAPGCYRWRHLRLELRQACTNAPPGAPDGGTTRHAHLWLCERIVDLVAHALELDAVDVRRRNYVPVEAMPYATPNGCVYDSGDYARCLDLALELVDHEAVRARQSAGAQGGRLVGLGIGSALDAGANTFDASLPLTYAVQVHACVVEVDRETGVVDLVDYAAVDDAGTRLDPQLLEAHVRRVTAHALGTAVGVRQALDEPPLGRGSTESPSPVTPLGAKGLGDGGGAGIHAVCAAIQDALRGAGGGVVAVSRHDPARVWELLRAPAASRALVQVVSR